jgi:hypothetical protein
MTNDERTGEKIGWIGGWLGGFLWVLVLGIVFAVRGDWAIGATGIVIFLVAIAVVFLMAPWRHPETPYLRLLVPPYGALVGSIIWVVAAFDAFDRKGFDPWVLLCLVPAFLPLFTMSRRRWRDGEAPPAAKQDPR